MIMRKMRGQMCDVTDPARIITEINQSYLHFNKSKERKIVKAFWSALYLLFISVKLSNADAWLILL